jgi:hypothetical protein
LIETGKGDGGIEWIALTDDEEAYVYVVEWSAKRELLKELGHVQLDAGSLASHAVWLRIALLT